MAKNTPPPFFITKSTSCNDMLHRNINGSVLQGILIQQIHSLIWLKVSTRWGILQQAMSIITKRWLSAMKASPQSDNTKL